MKVERVVPACVLLLLLSMSFVYSNVKAEKRRPAGNEPVVDHSYAGAGLYRDYCASCHGAAARGDGPAGRRLKVPPPDLTTMARKNGGHFPDGHVFQVIEWGGAIASHGAREMPVWGVAFRPLSDENQRQVSVRIHALTDYLGSIQLK